MMYGGGGGGGGDSTIIIVVLLICCVISALGGFYTCTGGTFDFDKFDKAKCLTIPGDDDKPESNTSNTSTYMGGGDWSNNYPTGYIQSDNFLICSGTLMPNDTRTCFNSGAESAGVRWAWSEIDGAAECMQLTATWRIDITSSKHDHGRTFTYINPISTANSFGFTGAPTGFVTGQNIRFRILALDSADNIVTMVSTTLDASGAASDCGSQGISNLKGFSDLTENTSVTEPEVPIDCAGGTYVAVGGCMVDGLAEDPNTCGSPCIQTYELRGHTEASGGGTCELTRNTVVNRESCEQFSQEAHVVVRDCFVTPGYPTRVDAERADLCSKKCDGGVFTQNYDITLPQNGGKECPPGTSESKVIACNTQACPVPCIGSWSAPQCRMTHKAGGKLSGTIEFFQTYTVSRAAAHGGTACDEIGGTEHIIGTYSARGLKKCEQTGVNSISGYKVIKPH